VRRVKTRHLIVGLLVAQLLLLGYIARLEYQIRAIAGLTYVELSSR
jgi:hypothetical protein